MLDYSIIRAKEILENLADGVNPMTGEALPASDSCNKVEVVRAIHTVLKYINTETEKPKDSMPENAGKPWTRAGYYKPEDNVLFVHTGGAGGLFAQKWGEGVDGLK